MNRVKLLIELAVNVIVVAVGGVALNDAINGGPQWKFLGLFVIWQAMPRIVSRWNKLWD